MGLTGIETGDIFPESYGAVADGRTDATLAIQEAINRAAETRGRVVLGDGVYRSGSLFLKSHMEFHLAEGAEIRGLEEEKDYPLVPSRIAGVEMTWPAGLINIISAENVKLTGVGVINGMGKRWWDKYWSMRKEYEAKNLRWAVDYDCFRPRNVVVYDSRHIELSGFRCIQSGFWNVHICYSRHVAAEGLVISDNQGPSTDGIDIDSSSNVTVRNCRIDCNDDNICIKSGRDWDGLRVARPCHDVLVRDCTIGRGAGITLGSETSGGMYNIKIENNAFDGTDQGFRIKSARNRGGLIENIHVSGLNMTNVSTAFSFQLNWNPTYSYCEIPEEYGDDYPEYWDILSRPVPEEEGMPEVRNVFIENVTGDSSAVKGTAFNIEGLESLPLGNIQFRNMEIRASHYGVIRNVSGLRFDKCSVNIEPAGGRGR